MNDKIKLVFFDMEGTIFKKVYKDAKGNTAPSAWCLLAEHLGEQALKDEEINKDKWNNKEYAGYVEWMEDTIRIHKKYGLDKEFFENVINQIEYHPGVKETFLELKKRGIRTSLISGGFKAQSDRAQKDLKINHAFAACEYFWDDDGKLLHWNLLPCDYEGKADFMELIIKEHGLKKNECAFVGDGKNDIFLAKEVGLSIAFNGPRELQDACTHSINQENGNEDFIEVLKYL
ncbi:HAD-IB family phosphatase [Candidatus Woesearchaeota archaeon]|nr:HAD-IB family phosphatase [Candidatus Woesearchaeota archaeon]MBT3538385.1 HAD-IB family phosphatase [Candidatus Woesearchaeota archaeon]MBT4697052.1 HAD-IB family phosphatase [Candidatus Woesearchaeota archaeon]MBT4716378.1 HAD-IB family phosphatase [Candidatus Woesearchaeota archaeon]MBT7106054.1 HAD-IB family phosphatase [Candidatus Woesearchaeota archaeon]